MATIGTTLAVGLALLGGQAHGDEPFEAFARKKQSTIDTRAKGWHDAYEDDDEYGEVWFFLVQTDEGGLLFTMLSITNLGPGTFNGTWDVNFYDPAGKSHKAHQEYDRDEVKASKAKMDTTIGPARVWEVGGRYHMHISSQAVGLDLALAPTIGAQQFGGGEVVFGEDRDEHWFLGLNAPRGRVTGKLRIGGETYPLDGEGYHDHSWSTLDVPAYIRKWYAVRIYDPKLTLVLHHQYLNDDYGKKSIRYGILGTGDAGSAKVSKLRGFRLRPKRWRKEPESGKRIPVELEVSAKAGGTTVKGTIVEARFLEALDVLGQLSWPVRTAIKAFYTDAWHIRFFGRYELDLTAADGTTTHVSGLAPVEANYY